MVSADNHSDDLFVYVAYSLEGYYEIITSVYTQATNL
jgi:hypothetical protein